MRHLSHGAYICRKEPDAPDAWIAQYQRKKFGKFVRWAGFIDVTFPLSRDCCPMIDRNREASNPRLRLPLTS